MTVQNGYGLTETSPVIAARQLSCNVSSSFINCISLLLPKLGTLLIMND